MGVYLQQVLMDIRFAFNSHARAINFFEKINGVFLFFFFSRNFHKSTYYCPLCVLIFFVGTKKKKRKRFPNLDEADHWSLKISLRDK